MGFPYKGQEREILAPDLRRGKCERVEIMKKREKEKKKKNKKKKKKKKNHC